MILHYDSSREGLECIVIELVRAIARKLLHTEISVEIIKQKEQPGDDVQFAIKEIHSPEISTLLCKANGLDTPWKRTYFVVVGAQDFSRNVLSNISLSFNVWQRHENPTRGGIGIFDFAILAIF